MKVGLQLSPEKQAEEFYNQGIVALKALDLPGAEELFSKSLQLRPDFEKALNNRAIVYTQQKKYDQGVRDLNHSLLLNNANSDTWFNKSLLYFNLNLRDSQEVALDRCLRLNPDHAEAAYHKGVLLFDTRDYDKSINYFGIAIASDRRNAYAYNDRGSARREKGDYAAAISDYEKALI